MRKWIAGGLAALAAGALLAGAWLRNELTTPYYGTDRPEVFVEIPRGASSDAIARALQSAGVLHRRIPFLLYLRWSGDSRRLQAGEYRFTSPSTPGQVAARLVEGNVFFYSVTIPEGLTALESVTLVAGKGLGNLQEMKAALARTEWIADLDPEARTLEGYLFPETYRFPRKTGSEEIVHAMVDQFRSRFEEIEKTDPLPNGWSPRRIVTLASLIEKEARNPEERRLVASVLTNRLRRRMPLGCDPTVIYALKLAGVYDGNIRKADLALESPYNTYVHAGLPPGPIACPGADSLRAALAPAESDYLYYVSKNDGTHQFSRNLRSHLDAVARYQKRRRR